MELTYDMIVVFIPIAFGLLFAIVGAYLGKNTVIQVRGLIDAVIKKGRPYVDDPKDTIIKWLAAELGLKPEQVIDLFKQVMDGLQQPVEINLSDDPPPTPEPK